jgi:PhzF family phenazine biosynthesis protein
MPETRLFVVDAFTREPFAGNPAAVVPLDRWPSDEMLHAIAAEMNLSETAFFVPEDDALRLRWFTPTVEVDLCGHATLASAFVVMNVLERDREEVRFRTKSGALRVTRDGDGFAMDFPSLPAEPVPTIAAIADALGRPPVSMLRSRDVVVAVYAHAAEVRALTPDFAAIGAVSDVHAVSVTAPGDGADVDFVSRFFAPREGIPEDPVTGSAHCTLAPYWSSRLGKTRLAARQVGRRIGELHCAIAQDRVILSGSAVLVIAGALRVAL